MLTLSRPSRILSDERRLSQEYASARWIYHRLLDFEFEHERVLAEVADQIAPGIVRVGRIVARLARRTRRAERTTEGQWYPNPHLELMKRLRKRLAELRTVRNADPRWKEACMWADTPAPGAPPRGGPRRKSEESDEKFAERCANRRDLLTRREAYRASFYAKRHIYWGTWNALCKSIDQARKDVLKRRKQGLPAEMRRPKYRDPLSLAADAKTDAKTGGFRIIERDVCGPRGGPIWWIVEMRLGLESEWVRVRAKCGTWHDVPADARIRTAKLTRRKDGERWSYSLSLTIDIEKPTDQFATTGMVAFDWGHREHGHPLESDGIRAWTWRGDDGATGEVLIPAECRGLLDEINALKSRVDTTFDARKKSGGLRDKNRYTYRRHLMRSGVRTEEEALWLQWEMKYERRSMKRRKRIQNLRREVYTQAVRELRSRYAIFAFEDESVDRIKRLQKDEQMERRKRANRDLATRYEFVSLCERFGAEMITVPARNTTRECPNPDCDGVLPVNGPELIVVCPSCGTARDKDEGAAKVIMRRAKEVLENRAA